MTLRAFLFLSAWALVAVARAEQADVVIYGGSLVAAERNLALGGAERGLALGFGVTR